MKPPTLIAVGDVVELRDKLNFFESKPLILLTKKSLAFFALGIKTLS